MRSIVPAAGLLAAAVSATVGCDDSRSGSPEWTAMEVTEAARARAVLDGAQPPDIDPSTLGPVPLQAVTGLAASPHGLVVGGVSPADDRFWDAWVIPSDGGPPRRLAPVDDLVAVDAGGALWTTIVSEDESGDTAYDVRLSPADGAPSAPLSAALPRGFAAERALADGAGGRLLIGSEGGGGRARRTSVFAVAADRTARRIASDPRADSALLVNAALTPTAVYLEILYGADRSPTIVKLPLPDAT